MKTSSFILALSSIFLAILPASYAEQSPDRKWSFNFNNLSILDAFKEIQEQTGVEIIVRKKTTFPILITYQCKDEDIFQVHSDILRNINHTSSWNYDDNGKLKSMIVVIIGTGDSNQNDSESTEINQAAIKIKDQKYLRSKLEKPPEAPSVMELRSPPKPPPAY